MTVPFIRITLALAAFASTCLPAGASAPKAASSIAAARSATVSRATPLAHEAYGKLPLSFEANRGQADESVNFLARGPGYTLALSPTEAVFGLRKAGLSDQQSTVLRMNLVGANREATVVGVDELEGKVNYLLGNDPARWRTNIPTFARVRYGEVYPGIDVVYYGNQRRLEYDFVVAPGRDPRTIALEFAGAESVAVEPATGDLLVCVAGETIRQQAPVTYQETADGGRREVESRYALNEDGRVGFEVGEYDTNAPLIIDPVLVYSTYLGGSGQEIGYGIAVDPSGNAYVTGETYSANFPTTPGAFDTSLGGFRDAFVTKLNATGTSLVYSTYLGGSSDDGGTGIAVDSAGNAYVTGKTVSLNFPTTAGAFDTTYNGGGFDAFVVKLNATGTGLVYSTYLGGAGPDGTSARVDVGNDIAIDGAGNAHVTGMTNSTSFPTVVDVFDTTYNGGFDAFVTKFNATGTGLIYSTYLGGSGSLSSSSSGETGLGIAVDSAGDAYVTGYTNATDFPTTTGAFDTTHNGGFDAFLTKLNATGTSLIYSTHLGGGGGDSGLDIAVDSASNAYLTGETSSTNFPTTAGAFDTTPGSSSDAFVTKLNATGTGLIFSTFLGESANGGDGIAVDSAGSPYVTGFTVDSTAASGVDAFVTKLNAAGTGLLDSTFFRGSGNDFSYGVAVDSAGNAYLTGSTESPNFPIVPGSFDTTLGGISDAFVLKISFGGLLSAVSRKTHGTAGTFDVNLPLVGEPGVECRSGGGNYTLVFTFSRNPVSGNASVTAGTGSVAGSPTFSGATMTVNLTGVADVQRISVTLNNVTDTAGQVLPDASVSVTMLIGDINASKVVNASDIGAVKAQSGVPVTATNFRADVAVSGGISASDIGLVKSRSGASVP